MNYGYNLYGLKVNSTFKIEGFSHRDKYVKPDAVIKFTSVTEPAPGLPETHYKPFTIFNKTFYYLNIPTIAKYYVNQGDQVSIELHDKKMRKAAIVFFKDTILSILLIKNKLFPIHASAVRAKDGVYLLCYQGAEGKSSLAARLCLNGYQFLSDDKVILNWNKKQNMFTCKCYSPYVELWKDVLPIFKKSSIKLKKKVIRKGIEKYTIDFRKNSCKKTMSIKGIFKIKVVNDKIKPNTKIIKGFKKLEIIKNQIHMNHMIDIIEANQAFFQLNTLISKHIPIIQIERSKIMSIHQVAKYIEHEIYTKTAFS